MKTPTKKEFMYTLIVVFGLVVLMVVVCRAISMIGG